MTYICVILVLILATVLQAAPLDLQTEASAPVLTEVFQSSPNTLNRSDLTLAIGAGYSCLVAKLFEDSDRLAGNLEQTPLDDSFDFGNWYGKGSTMGVAAVGFYGLGRMIGSERMTATGCDLTQSLLAAWSVSWALKWSINAERPNGHDYSFPSGHTATAFAAAPIFHNYYGNWAGAAAYALASLTGLARVEDHRHHLSDVLAGATIGYISGRTCTGGRCLKIISGPNGPGLGVSRDF